MSGSKRTEGPWQVTQRDGKVVVQGNASEWVAILPYAVDDGYGLCAISEILDNACLIAQAPTMLDALEHCKSYFNGREGVVQIDGECVPNYEAEMLARVNDAIKKATGQ